eukprot:578895-Prymnesium_polylepis.1
MAASSKMTTSDPFASATCDVYPGLRPAPFCTRPAHDSTHSSCKTDISVSGSQTHTLHVEGLADQQLAQEHVLPCTVGGAHPKVLGEVDARSIEAGVGRAAHL